VARKDLADQPVSELGQRDGDEPPVVVAPLLGDEAAANEVGHDDRRVAVAPQQLVPEIALAQRAMVQQRLQHPELSDREPGPGHHAAHPRGDGLGRAHELDVGIQRRRLRRVPRIARGHGSNSNGL
jgi:hypothetical protein